MTDDTIIGKSGVSNLSLAKEGLSLSHQLMQTIDDDTPMDKRKIIYTSVLQNTVVVMSLIEKDLFDDAKP